MPINSILQIQHIIQTDPACARHVTESGQAEEIWCPLLRHVNWP
jgi:hypothetical protein